MTDHLPECETLRDDGQLDGCICAALRACEQRLTETRINMEDPL